MIMLNGNHFKNKSMNPGSIKPFIVLSFTLISICSKAQFPETQFTIAEASPKCMVMQRVGIADVEIHYCSPSVRGRGGKIWNSFTVPYDGNPFPWRAGANENTTISISKDVTIDGNPVPAGTYGFHTIPSNGEWTLIFSKNSTSWGSFTYKQEEDMLRIKVKPDSIAHQEWLRYEFMDAKQGSTTSSAKIALSWEKVRVSFKIEENSKQHVLDTINAQLRGVKQFFWDSWYLAATWAIQRKIYLDEAMKWIDKSIQIAANFSNTTKKAQLFELLNKPEEAKKMKDLALQLASPIELFQQGRQLLFSKKVKEAMDLFQLNLKRNGDQLLVVTDGLARGYSASGDFKQAIKYARLSLVNTVDEKEKAYWGKAIKTLEEGKDFSAITFTNVEN